MKELVRFNEIAVARGKISELHKRVFSTIAAILVVVLPPVLLLPFVKSMMLGEEYIGNLKNWSQSIILLIVGREASYLTVAFGVIAIGVALFALSANRAPMSTTGEMWEADDVSQYVSILNALFSIYFAIVFSCSIAVTLIPVGLPPSFNVFLTSFLGMAICGILSGFIGQSPVKRIDARRSNEEYKMKLLLLLDRYDENEMKGMPNIYCSTIGQAAILVAVVSLVELLAGVLFLGVLLATLVSLIYGTLTVNLYLYLRISRWNVINPENVTSKLLLLISWLMWPLTVILSGVLVSSAYSMSGDLGGTEAGFFVAVFQLLTLIIMRVYLSKSSMVENGVLSRQSQIIRSRVDSINIWLGNFRDWMRPPRQADVAAVAG